MKLVRLLGVVAGLVGLSSCQPTPEELARRAAVDRAAALRAEQLRALEAKARVDAMAARRKEHAAAIEELRATYAAMTPVDREQALRKLCATNRACTPEARATLVSAVSSEAEGRKLHALADRLGERLDSASREAFAEQIAADFSLGITERVLTSGSPGKMFLIIHDRYCSEKRVDAFMAGPHLFQAIALGYDHVVCSGPRESWERDLR